MIQCILFNTSIMISRTRNAQARPLSGRPSTVCVPPLTGLRELTQRDKQTQSTPPRRPDNGSANQLRPRGGEEATCFEKTAVEAQ